jgi:hypothetical protein
MQQSSPDPFFRGRSRGHLPMASTPRGERDAHRLALSTATVAGGSAQVTTTTALAGFPALRRGATLQRAVVLRVAVADLRAHQDDLRRVVDPRTRNRGPGNARDRRCGADRFQSSPARLSAFRIGRRDCRVVNRSRVTPYASPFANFFEAASLPKEGASSWGLGPLPGDAPCRRSRHLAL